MELAGLVETKRTSDHFEFRIVLHPDRIHSIGCSRTSSMFGAWKYLLRRLFAIATASHPIGSSTVEFIVFVREFLQNRPDFR